MSNINVSGIAIKPCPFCGGKSIELMCYKVFDELNYVSPKKKIREVMYVYDATCRNCKAKTGRGQTEKKNATEITEAEIYDLAVELWNTRAESEDKE